jgi:hypothetical protein
VRVLQQIAREPDTHLSDVVLDTRDEVASLAAAFAAPLLDAEGSGSCS